MRGRWQGVRANGLNGHRFLGNCYLFGTARPGVGGRPPEHARETTLDVLLAATQLTSKTYVRVRALLLKVSEKC